MLHLSPTMNAIKYLTLISGIGYAIVACGQSLPIPGLKEIHISDRILHPPFGEIVLEPEEDDLIFHFIDTVIVDWYNYQLTNLDDRLLSTVCPYTRYTNLSGGDYVFTLSTILSQDTSAILSLPIKVLPKPTEASWFIPSLVLYVALVILALALFWLMYHYRQKMQIQRIRNQIARDLHDEVGSTLSSIAIFSKVLKRDMQNNAPEVEKTLDNIIQSAESTNSNLDASVWFLDPELDQAGDLFERIRAEASQLFAAQDIQLTFKSDLLAIKDFGISMLQRRNVYLMASEAINNIIKHSKATEVSISISKEGRKIRLTIQDNGQGFSEAEVKRGNGLKNFRARAKESFIHFSLKSEPQLGTTISLLIPQL